MAREPETTPSDRPAQAQLESAADSNHATELRIVLPFGSLAMFASLVSLAVCYGINLARAIFDVALPINPHLQGVIMWGFALLAVYALWRDRRTHANSLPIALGGAGAAVLIATLYLNYDTRVEALAYVLIVIAALLNQNAFLVTLNRTVRRQAQEIEALNRHLAQTVESQDHEIDRLGRLKQFLAPQVAELVVAEKDTHVLDTHRRYIACLFCDLRSFTAAAERAEPEEVIEILQAFHDRVGELVLEHRGTIGFRAGDGLMAFFNDPLPCAEPVLDAVRLGLDIRSAFEALRASWPVCGGSIGLGIGIGSGYATLGLIGFRGRADYTAVGRVVNVASRLCDRAADGEILLGQRAYQDVEARVDAEPLGAADLKGVTSPVEIHRLRALRQTE
ncbi:MAG: MerC family mercury resistance protein [Tistlia sp.]|uniref:adenylate/guanylate cyclase domain-containing protein n=1 Tax=Tistlia sp. TaxID=3057121 RepID=UPI0034A1071D